VAAERAAPIIASALGNEPGLASASGADAKLIRRVPRLAKACPTNLLAGRTDASHFASFLARKSRKSHGRIV
jgi:hypothetical protein